MECKGLKLYASTVRACARKWRSSGTVHNSDVATNEMKLDLTSNQNVGREVAKLIENEAYEKGFVTSLGFSYQYDRFTDMIQYTQNNYFMAKNIPFTSTFEMCLSTAIKDCIRNFVDAKCIIVY